MGQEEVELLAKAIDGLRQESNYFKDYAFPIASALFTSILGAGIAYLTLRHQDSIQIEKEKMDSTNKWILQVDEALGTLFSFKANYNGRLTEVPFQRLGAIPTILFHADSITESHHSLSFIVPTNKEKKSESHKWSQLALIRTMVSNYNYLLKLWGQRNEMNEVFKGELVKKYGGESFATLTIDDAVSITGKAHLIMLIDLNERVIKLTDDLITELNSFLVDFPAYAKTRVNLKKIKKYGSILTFSHNENQSVLEIIERSPEVDFKSLGVLFGEPSDIIKARYSNGYDS